MGKLYLRLLITLLLGCSYNLSSQSISAPSLTVPYACATPSFNSYNASTSYSGIGFNSDNLFILEMSDSNGDFSSPFNMATVSDQNYRSAWAFDFINFAFPENIGGDGFKLRVRATSPAKVSPSSNAFSYYYYDGTSIVLNEYNPVSLCGSKTSTIKVVPANYSRYKWYKDAVLIQGASTSSLEVSEPGIYFAEVDLGPCNLNIVESISNTVTVSRQDERDVSIAGPNEISVCSTSRHTFEAVGLNPTDSVQWFKNDTAITEVGNFYTYTTPTNNAKGTYYFKLNPSSSNDCSSQSQSVVLNYESSFTINSASASYQLLLPPQTALLTIATSASKPIVEWYKNNSPIASSNNLTYTATEPGIYKALVRDSSGCSSPLFSDSFTIEVPSAYEIEIGASLDYVACQTESITMQVQGIKAIAPDESIIKLESSSITLFSYQWFKNNEPIAERTTASFTANTSDNGTYKVRGAFLGTFYESNEFVVELSDIDATITSSDLTICPEGSTLLVAIENPSWSYQWLKDGVQIPGANSSEFLALEAGSYTCRIDDEFCTVISIPLNVVSAVADSIVVSPSTEVDLTNGFSQTLTATGGDSYEWIDADGTVLSNTASLTITEPGDISLQATIGRCTFNRLITATENLTALIPNVITINGDGLNEKWVLPSTYRSADVSVTIYDTAGSQVYTASNYQNSWPENSDGTTNTVFYYIIKKNNSTLKKGTITILR